MKTKRLSWKIVTGSLAGLAVVVAVVHMAYFFHKNYEDTVVSQTQQQLLMSARSIAVGIEQFVTEHSDDLRTISRNPKIQEKAYKSILVKKTPTGHSICRDLYEAHKDHVDAFTILDSKGIMLRRIPHWEERIGEDHSDKPGIAYVLRKHKAHVSEAFYNNSGNLAISISEPVFYEDEFAGMVRWMIQIDRISKLFIKPIKVGKKRYVHLLDDKGKFLYHPREDFKDKTCFQTLAKHKKEFPDHDWSGLRNIVAKRAKGEEGVGIYDGTTRLKEGGIQPMRKIVAYTPVHVGKRKWAISTIMPYSEIKGPIREHERNTFGVAGIAILMFVGGGVLLFRARKRKAELETETKYLKQVARSAEALRESKEKLAGIIDSVTDHMIMVDEQFNIVWANDFAKEVFGPDMVGKKCYSAYHGRDRVCNLCIAKQCFEDGKVHEFETDIVVLDGNQKTFWCTASVAAWHDDDRPKMVVEFLRDITKRKQAGEQIRGSLREKEVLLKEIHHRVKNNLQVISSLLKLQSEYAGDEEYTVLLKESQNRIKAMALVHEKLYQSKDLASIDLNEYINHLANALFRTYGVDMGRIALKIDVADVMLGVVTAIPCGLIINELISNSLKYAFPGGKQGEIKITLGSRNKGNIELTVSDNGIGMPKDLDFRETESFGLKLVHILTDQLGGKLEIDRSEGTSIHIQFKKIEYKEMT